MSFFISLSYLYLFSSISDFDMESFTQDSTTSVIIGSQQYSKLKASYYGSKIKVKINMQPNDLSIVLIFKVSMKKLSKEIEEYEAFEENI